MANHLTLAVAGGRKTQGLVEHCKSLPIDRRVLVVTFTQTNQLELRHRLASQAGDLQNLEVMGWYTFLLRHFAKPFLPFILPSERVGGFDFEGRPYFKAVGKARYMNRNNEVYASELGRLAFEAMQSSGGVLKHRLECLYEEILFDEVQDLSGYDWEIVHQLLLSKIDVRMVGDVRQSVLSTNPRGQKNKNMRTPVQLNGSVIAKPRGYCASTTRRSRTDAEPKSQAFQTQYLMPRGDFRKPRLRTLYARGMMVFSSSAGNMSTITLRGFNPNV